MEYLKNSDAQKIFELFTTILTKSESLYLFGLYYSLSNDLSEKNINKSLIIAQQFLTYLKRNSIEDVDIYKISVSFYDEFDSLNENCHPDYFIQDDEEIDFEKIHSNISGFNKHLDIKINFPFDKSYVANIELV